METHEYQKRGKTQGSLRNIPTATCRICGDSISQPLPTGLWTHNGRADNDYIDSSWDGKSDHIPTPASIIETLLSLNKNEDRDYGEGQCHLHRLYWLSQTKLKKKEIERMIGTDRIGNPWYYWKWKNKRTNSLAVENFVKKKKYVPRKKNFPNPKILIVLEISGKPDIEIEIGMSQDWVQENLYACTKYVYVGKKLYKLNDEIPIKKVSPKLTVYKTNLKGSLGKYDKEELENYDLKEIPNLEDLFQDYIGFLDGSTIYDHGYKLNE